MSRPTSSPLSKLAPKVPEITALFWVIKILTTGMGESASDFLGQQSVPLAGATGVSLRRLQTRFKEHLGRTILQEINGRRILHAKALLGRTTKKIRVVAGECGFGNAVKMVRIFKQYEGVSPKHYRKQAGGTPAPQQEQPVHHHEQQP